MHPNSDSLAWIDEPTLPDPPPPPRTSGRAIASLVCALLVLPVMMMSAALFLVPASSGRGMSYSTTSRTSATGERVYYLDYQDETGSHRIGPSKTPLTRRDIPEPPSEPGETALMVLLIAVLLLPLGLEVAAVVLGVKGLRDIAARPRELVGRGWAIAGLVIAGLNAGALLLTVVAGVVLAMRLSVS